MRKAFNVAIVIFMVILFLAAVVMIILAFKDTRNSGMYIMSGIGCAISAFSLYGFLVIVNAAHIYIEKNMESDE